LDSRLKYEPTSLEHGVHAGSGPEPGGSARAPRPAAELAQHRPAGLGNASTVPGVRHSVGKEFRMSDKADGHASPAAQEADAVDEVSRNTKSQTTAASYTTSDHDVIRQWAEVRGARPATVSGTSDSSSGGGILRLEFDRSDDQLDDTAWDTFFEVFDDRQLAFIYQEKTSDGQTSRFNKFVSRDAS
jgi:hypothetical protein